MKMETLHGGWPRANSSSATRLAEASLLSQWLVLLGAGALATLIHEAVRIGLHLPGHHGIEWLAILFLARTASSLRGAALVVAVGAILASMASATTHEPLSTRWLTYLLQAGAIDALFVARPSMFRSLPALLLSGAAIHAVAPLTKLATHLLTGAPFGSLAQGIGYPLLSHMLFGACGAMAAWFCMLLARRQTATLG